MVVEQLAIRYQRDALEPSEASAEQMCIEPAIVVERNVLLVNSLLFSHQLLELQPFVKKVLMISTTCSVTAGVLYFLGVFIAP